MIRKIIKIHEDKCNGCGICINACHEGALQLIDGKAKLVSDVYCDGLGACLPACPEGALEIIEREADEFDEIKVKQKVQGGIFKMRGCMSTKPKLIMSKNNKEKEYSSEIKENSYKSELRQWPCQIKLVPTNAPYLNNAKLLIAADCTAFSYGGIQQFIKDRITLIGCPKLDDGDYSEKLSQILIHNNIKDILVLRMEVPCCSGIVNAVQKALKISEKTIQCKVITIGIDGEILSK
ncbi:MAG: 4Fe-4S binding protein [Clostridia bacterium]|nr:4Fe-4S binding protein [Clostridia bacterium]